MKGYPDVKGMSKNVVFFTHNHKEDGGQESVSKVNSFEVWIRSTRIRNPQNKLFLGENDRGSGDVLPAPRGIQQSR